MQCNMGDPDYQKMHDIIKSAIDEYTAAHPDIHISVALTMKMPTNEDGSFQIMSHQIQAGDLSMTQPERIDLEDIPSENDGHDPGKQLQHIVVQLGRAGHRADALELAQRAIDRFPTSPFAYACLAMAFVVNNNNGDGLNALQTAATILDTDDWALSHTEYQLERRLEVGQYFRVFRDTREASRQFEKAIEIAEAADLPMWAARARKMLEYV